MIKDVKDNKLLFIGSMNRGLHPRGGAEAKNQILWAKLKNDYGERISCIDTTAGNRLFNFFQLIGGILCHSRIILSIGVPALLKISYLNFLLKNKTITIFVVGGEIHKSLNIKRLNDLLELSKLVYAETKELVGKISNYSDKIQVKYLPNFKSFPNTSFASRKVASPIKLLFLSRINSDKGVFRCIEVVKYLNFIDTSNRYLLDIYGVFDMSIFETNLFESELSKFDYINYKGFIDLNDMKSYDTLNYYHFYLFLTNYVGEGFPGSLIDAMIAKVPIIASNWKYNEEILTFEDEKLGEIINLDKNYIQNTASAIRILVSNPLRYEEQCFKLSRASQLYNIDKIRIDLP